MDSYTRTYSIWTDGISLCVPPSRPLGDTFKIHWRFFFNQRPHMVMLQQELLSLTLDSFRRFNRHHSSSCKIFWKKQQILTLLRYERGLVESQRERLEFQLQKNNCNQHSVGVSSILVRVKCLQSTYSNLEQMNILVGSAALSLICYILLVCFLPVEQLGHHVDGNIVILILKAVQAELSSR